MILQAMQQAEMVPDLLQVYQNLLLSVHQLADSSQKAYLLPFLSSYRMLNRLLKHLGDGIQKMQDLGQQQPLILSNE